MNVSSEVVLYVRVVFKLIFRVWFVRDATEHLAW